MRQETLTQRSCNLDILVSWIYCYNILSISQNILPIHIGIYHIDMYTYIYIYILILIYYPYWYTSYIGIYQITIPLFTLDTPWITGSTPFGSSQDTAVTRGGKAGVRRSPILARSMGWSLRKYMATLPWYHIVVYLLAHGKNI